VEVETLVAELLDEDVDDDDDVDKVEEELDDIVEVDEDDIEEELGVDEDELEIVDVEEMELAPEPVEELTGELKVDEEHVGNGATKNTGGHVELNVEVDVDD
jgi:hypothetical protein